MERYKTHFLLYICLRSVQNQCIIDGTLLSLTEITVLVYYIVQ